MIKRPENFDWLTSLLLLFFTCLGAVAKIAYNAMIGIKTSWFMVLCQMVVSLFIGGLAVLIASMLDLPFETAGCLAGTGGWLGAEFIKIIIEQVKNRVENNTK